MTDDLPANSENQMSVLVAILAGQLIVNLPAVVVLLGVALTGRAYLPSLWWLFLLIGFIVGWLWWSFAVPRWRRWALKRGCPPNVLHRWAVFSGLEWPNGSIFEKTEYK